ncbi:MAG: xanthine dehydrogenase family protein subunit M [Deltaproteobacteria bacterium]|nr:xanthine dehydrogenase family protein subunit M [Deltaproteobacteria bacterium]
MKKFAHFNASTMDEAVSLLRRFGGRANLIAGGTDLLGKMKDRILPTYPEALINLKTIPGLDGIREVDGALRIGPLTRLQDIAASETVREQYAALAEAAHRTASPHLREMGTIGGNICQDIRCWYYRCPNNRFPCLRKGGGRCYALEGDHRYHSIDGGSVVDGCIAVHPGDTAPALIALNARVRTSKRTLDMEDFFQVGMTRTTVLDDDEIVTGIHVPRPPEGSRSHYLKFALRKSIDFPIVNCAARITQSGGAVSDARICLNAVYVKPYRAKEAEASILGKKITEAAAETAGNAAVIHAKPLRDNTYMVQIAKVFVKRAILACR